MAGVQRQANRFKNVPMYPFHWHQQVAQTNVAGLHHHTATRHQDTMTLSKNRPQRPGEGLNLQPQGFNVGIRLQAVPQGWL
jgi:hypothetical protein